MCFHKTGVVVHSNFQYGNVFLEDVNEFLYLGFLVTANGSIISGIRNLQERALKAFYGIKNSLSSSLTQFPVIAFKIFDFIVKPIALYASDFWGFHKGNVGKSGISEQIHTKFCKWILGVSKRTSNAAVALETGRYPLYIEGVVRCFDNNVRILGTEECNELTQISDLEAFESQNNMYRDFQKFFESHNLSFIINNIKHIQSKGNTSKALKKYLKQHFINEQQKFQCYNVSKMAVIKIAKTDQGMSSFIKATKMPLRRLIAKLRLSDHTLQIERGRYNQITPYRRICKVCKKGVEDVVHFLFSCPLYRAIRINLLKDLDTSIPNFSSKSINDQLIGILNPNETTSKCIAEFLHTAFEARSEALNPLQ